MDYTAVEGEDGQWGVVDEDGACLYDSDMTKTQAMTLATLHREGIVIDFDSAIAFLEDCGIQFAELK